MSMMRTAFLLFFSKPLLELLLLLVLGAGGTSAWTLRSRGCHDPGRVPAAQFGVLRWSPHRPPERKEF